MDCYFCVSKLPGRKMGALFSYYLELECSNFILCIILIVPEAVKFFQKGVNNVPTF